MDMNTFIRQNFGRGVAFKNFTSWGFEGRFLCSLTEILRNNGSARGLLFVERIAICGDMLQAT